MRTGAVWVISIPVVLRAAVLLAAFAYAGHCSYM
ncbi:hypothetical protein Xinn_01532 [Xenorhabdus innexi]|uniref:Uncharacterized protein n=1 Tax=Xenorhabdus innexi TaxID=290109 RepID=A0A2G0NPF6_9GAMM|nr:hypothetical protein Xinn_01532 [Xenorhabdus innexi]